MSAPPNKTQAGPHGSHIKASPAGKAQGLLGEEKRGEIMGHVVGYLQQRKDYKIKGKKVLVKGRFHLKRPTSKLQTVLGLSDQHARLNTTAPYLKNKIQYFI